MSALDLLERHSMVPEPSINQMYPRMRRTWKKSLVGDRLIRASHIQKSAVCQWKTFFSM